jgi:hypothetical protein
MTPDSEIELWSLWLGGDTTKHFKTMPKVSNISNVDLKDIEDLIDKKLITEMTSVSRQRSFHVKGCFCII